MTGLPVARQRCDRAFFPDSIDGTRYFGTVNGAMTLVQTLGSFFGPWLVGALVDETGAYTVGWLECAAFAALSVPLMLLAIPPHGLIEAYRDAPPASEAAT